MAAPYIGVSTDANVPGITGKNVAGIGVHGESKSSTAVSGVSDTGIAVHGVSQAGPWAIRGEAANGTGVHGESRAKTGVGGISESWRGIHGVSKQSDGVFGESDRGRGVVGVAKTATGVEGNSTSGVGVWGMSETGEGVHAQTKSRDVAAIAGFNLNPEGTGAAIFGKKEGAKGHAGFFDGNVHVTGNLMSDGDIFLKNADCAEDFDVADLIEPGTAMVVGEDGILLPSQHAYDKRVAGVISGAGAYQPGIVLDKQNSENKRQPVALLGKVFCKVDAQYGAVEVGDLLTTSDTPGHAMKVTDSMKAFGAVIGKALRPLREGQGLIPILIALQ